jgi:outer membrane protein OmpU
MKKILLATTVLGLSAGVAAADVTISGDGRMGILYDNATAAGAALPAGTRTLAFTSRIRVAFTVAGETDGGVAFGGTIRADNAAAGALGQAGSVFVSFGGMELRMGDVDGAAERVVGDLHEVGLTGLSTLNETTYLSNGAAGVRSAARFTYSVDGLTASISSDNPRTGARTMAIGFGYAASGFNVGIGYEASSPAGVGPNSRHIIATAGYSMDGYAVRLIAGRLTTGGVNSNQFGISGSATFDATTVAAFARRDFARNRHVGIGAEYSLGGGAFLEGGIVNTKFNAAGTRSRTQADFGVRFAF